VSLKTELDWNEWIVIRTLAASQWASPQKGLTMIQISQELAMKWEKNIKNPMAFLQIPPDPSPSAGTSVFSC
jgi:hypothetical protein